MRSRHLCLQQPQQCPSPNQRLLLEQQSNHRRKQRVRQQFQKHLSPRHPSNNQPSSPQHRKEVLHHPPLRLPQQASRLPDHLSPRANHRRKQRRRQAPLHIPLLHLAGQYPRVNQPLSNNVPPRKHGRQVKRRSSVVSRSDQRSLSVPAIDSDECLDHRRSETLE